MTHRLPPLPIAALLVALLAAGPVPAAGEQPSSPEVPGDRFEVRLAADQPRDGWSESTHPRTGRPLYLAAPAALTGEDVDRVWLEAIATDPQVGISFTRQGAEKAARFSRENLGAQTAILVGGKVVSVVRIAGELGRRIRIQGAFSAAEARTLAAALAPGSFPATPLIREPAAGEAVRFEIRLLGEEPRDGWLEMTHPMTGQPVYVTPEAAITQDDVERAWFDESASGVGLLLTEEATIEFALFTRRHVGEPIALIVNGWILSAPRIAAEITGGRALIQGGLSETEARGIAAALNRPSGGEE